MKKIIGFSAKKQGGKTTAVNYLVSECLRLGKVVEPINFADALKVFVMVEFCPKQWTFADLEDNKNAVLPCGQTVRRILQIVGSDWFRQIDPDWWVNKWQAQVLESRAEIILVGDVRFANEVQAIGAAGGKTIRLLRAPFPEDQHSSETALDSTWPHIFDGGIDNTEMSIPEQNAAVAEKVVSLYPELAGVGADQ